jgi:Asp-tRNA(Asn)/Glu-tRNA(Gln) amidotransferase A subunit family amidase
VGSQTGGSVIRPATYCGVFGFKPTHGLISRHGMFQLSRTLDHVGVFARTLEDVALLAEVLVGGDARDPDSRASAQPRYREIAASEPPIPPLFAFVKTARWEHVDADAREAFASGWDSSAIAWKSWISGEPAVQALEWHRTSLDAEMAANLDWGVGARARAALALHGGAPRPRPRRPCPRLSPALARRRRSSRIRRALRPALRRPSSPRQPRDRAARARVHGDPAFNAVWTLCGDARAHRPAHAGRERACRWRQLVGPRLGEARLLRTAKWLVETVQAG